MIVIKIQNRFFEIKVVAEADGTGKIKDNVTGGGAPNG
jgi:hypothetical protein